MIGYPRAINTVGTLGMFLVFTHLDRSFSSSPVPFPLYICCFFFSFFYFSQQISNQSTTVHSIMPSFHLLGATVLYAFLVASFVSLNYKYLELYAKFSLCFSIYSNIACSSFAKTCRVLGFYLSRVGDIYLVRR